MVIRLVMNQGKSLDVYLTEEILESQLTRL